MEEFDHICEGADAQGTPRDHGLSERLQLGDSGVDERERTPRAPLNRSNLWKATLEQAIQAAVVPRLLASLAQPHEERPSRTLTSGPDLTDHLSIFVDLVLRTDAEAALTYIAALQAGGASGESICLDLLTPAARRLGGMWIEDSCDFMDVTVGVQRLHRILRMLGSDRPNGAGNSSVHNRILLTPAPGESHVFGVAIVEKFFVDAGWDVTRASESDFIDTLKIRWFDVMGFSLSENRNLDRLKTAIAGARSQSLNPHLRILVGGPVFLDKPDLAKRVGADAMAQDALSAVLWAGNLPDPSVIV